MRNYISIALLFLASSVFAYDPPTMGWSSWMPDIDGFTKEVIAGYVLEGIFILLYS
jgi:hypothetical protein